MATAARRQSGFTPAVRIPRREEEEYIRGRGRDQEEDYGAESPTMRPTGGRTAPTRPPPSPREEPSAERVTKTGLPDRRFKGQRDLPPQEEVHPDYTPARTGGTLSDGTHVTLTGKPDRRFKENRGLSEEEVNQRWAEAVAAEYGITARRH